MSNEQVASPFIVVIDGEDYEFVPLKLVDIVGTATDYLQLQPVAALLKQRDAFEPQVFEEMLVSKKQEVKAIEFGTQRFNEELFKPRNIVYLLWLSLRKKHPEIKFPAFEHMLQHNADAFEMLFDNLNRIIVMSDSEPKEEDSPTRKEGEGKDEGKKR